MNPRDVAPGVLCAWWYGIGTWVISDTDATIERGIWVQVHPRGHPDRQYSALITELKGPLELEEELL